MLLLLFFSVLAQHSPFPNNILSSDIGYIPLCFALSGNLANSPPIPSSKLLFCKLWSFKAQHHNPGSSAGKEDPSSIPGSERTPGEDTGYLHQYSWASLVAQLVKNPPAIWRPGFDPWFGKIPWRREQLPTPVFWPGEFRGLYSPCGCKELDMTFTLCFVYSHTL